MKLGTEDYSPTLLAKIEYAGGNHPSFAVASQSLRHLADLSISPKHVQRLTERLGQERQARRDAQVEKMKRGELKPKYKQAPAIVAIHVDAGKAQFRQEDAAPGVRHPHWCDVKVACLQSYQSLPAGKGDPQPDPPAAFLDPPRVVKLVRQMERVRSQGQAKDVPAAGSGPPLLKRKRRHKPPKKIRRPKRRVRTVVASTAKVESFGWMVATEATTRNFYDAAKRAIIGDGGNWIEPLAELHFPGWEMILDFLHLLVHLWAGAMAACRGRPKEGWELYERMLRDAWGGRVEAVIGALSEQARRLGEPPKDAKEEDPRQIVWGTLRYVKANEKRMDYARYRREGLPISSALVESLIKQINFRMKGTEKFWVSCGAEAVLQVRAAYLSEDGRAEEFHLHRPRGPAVGKNRRLVPT